LWVPEAFDEARGAGCPGCVRK
jgi:hypothetical protein